MDDMNRGMRLGRAPGRLAFWALAGVALLVSHDAVYLAQVGPGSELANSLRTAGHGYWGIASLGLALAGVTATTAVILRLRRLRSRASELGARTQTTARGYGTRALACWGRLFALVAIGFMIQESIEHGLIHGHFVGLGALIGPEYPLALPVLGVITLVGALLGAVVHRVETDLMASITNALRRLERPPRRLVRPPLRLSVRLQTMLAQANSGRAPPGPLVSDG
jgi:hypothetical protein